jgi:hypothetical protein
VEKEWKSLDAGIFRLNRVIEGETPLDLLCSQKGNLSIPEGFVDYDTQPREYILNSISVVINIHTRVSDLYNRPYDQVQEQLRLGIESLKERQENELINNDGVTACLKISSPGNGFRRVGGTRLRMIWMS